MTHYMSLQFLRYGHYWLEPAGKIGRLTNAQAVFTQRCMLANLHRGNGNRAKRRMGINPKHNTAGPWLRIAWQQS